MTCLVTETLSIGGIGNTSIATLKAPLIVISHDSDHVPGGQQVATTTDGPDTICNISHAKQLIEISRNEEVKNRVKTLIFAMYVSNNTDS